MNMRAPEIKWTAGGFVGGFLLCYLLLGPFRSQSPAPGLLTKATPVTPWLMTNSQLPEVRIALPDRWVEQVPGTPRSPKPLGYSLDLIDTRYQLPQPAKEP